MKIQLEDGAQMPAIAHETDAGYDLFSREDAVIPAGGSYVFDTGVHLQIPEWLFGLAVNRSGLNIRHGIVSENGVIDSGYTGAIRVKLQNNSTEDYAVKAGDRISQIVFLPAIKVKFDAVEQLEDTERGEKGFGSTGK